MDHSAAARKTVVQDGASGLLSSFHLFVTGLFTGLGLQAVGLAAFLHRPWARRLRIRRVCAGLWGLGTALVILTALRDHDVLLAVGQGALTYLMYVWLIR